MGRPRRIDDDALLDVAEQTLTAVGVRAMTLQEVAERAGVSAATLVNRFGSKRGMLVAIDRRWAATVDATVDTALDGVDDPVDRVRTAAMVWNPGTDDAERVANLVSALATDLLDPELRQLLGEGWGALEGRLARLIGACHRAGRLTGSPSPKQAARILFALSEGTRLAWAVRPVGSLRRRARRDLDAILTAWGE